MRKLETTNVLLGIGLFALIIIVYPSLKPVLEDVAAIVLTIAPGAGAFETFIIDTIPYWGLAVAFLAAFLVMIRGSKR